MKTDCLLRSGCRSASWSGCGRWRRCATRTARPSKPLLGSAALSAHRPAGHRKDAGGLREQGGAPCLKDALLRTEPGFGGADGQVRAGAQKPGLRLIEAGGKTPKASLWPWRRTRSCCGHPAKPCSYLRPPRNEPQMLTLRRHRTETAGQAPWEQEQT